MTIAARAQHVRSGPRYPWVVLVVVFFGTFLAIVNTTTVNVLLPVIGRDLDIAVGLEWVVTSYLLAVGITQPAAGWLVGRLGRRRVYTLGLLIFTVGSVMVGVAPSFGWLIACRLVQGVGGGMLLPVGVTLVVEAFPPAKRGAAMGIWGVALMAAPAVGPAVGGWLATTVGWRPVFLVNVPIGVLGTLAAWMLLRPEGRELGHESRRLDVVALALAGGGVSVLLLSLSAGREGLAPSHALGLAFGVWLLSRFARRQLRVPHPLIEVRMFSVPTFRRALLLGWLLMFAQHARLFLIPLELEAVRGASPLDAGLVIAPSALATAMFMPVGGRLVDRIGPRVPITVGLVLMGTGALLLSGLTPQTSLRAIVGMQVVQGIGAGFALLPATLASLNAVPTHLVPQASALRSVNQQLAAAMAVTVLALLIVSQLGDFAGPSPEQAQRAYNRGFLAVVGGLVLGLPLALRLPGRHENQRVQEQRQREVELAPIGA